MNNRHFLLLLIIFFSVQSSTIYLFAQISNRYVDKNATGSNNGLTWTNAYTSFSAINWATVNATDTIFISGGSNYKTYFEGFTVGKSGQDSTHRIVITKGKEPGHNGNVIIDGGGTKTPFLCANYNYIEVNGLQLQKGVKNGVIRIGNDSFEIYNIDIVGCTIVHPSGNGIKIYAAQGCKVQNNTLYTGLVNYPDDTDGIYLDGTNNGRGGDIIISGNTIINQNATTNSNYHKDNIQIAGGWSLTGVTKIYNNHLVQDNGNNKSYCSNLAVTSGSGKFIIYNNVIINTDSSEMGPELSSYGITIRNDVNPNAARNVEIYNNTIIGAQGKNFYPAYFKDIDSLIFKNNIVKGRFGYIITGSLPIYLNMNFNQFYKIDEAIARYSGTSYTLSAWRNFSSQDLNSSTNTVNFVDEYGTGALDMKLNNGSAGIDNGTSIPIFNTDYEDISRPHGGVWDRGAFEYKESGSMLDTIPPQLMIATIIDSSNLVLTFSEALENYSAQDKTNYSINNGIIINSASLDPDLKKVFLNTTQNSVNQTYEVAVNNVLDLAGNLISPQNNTATYVYQPDSVAVQLNVEGVLASVVPEPNHHAEKTLDGKGYYQGDPDSRWAGDTMPEWLVYDLGDVQILNQTKLSFFNWHNGRVYNYSLQVSSDSVNWNELRTNILSSAGEWSIEEIGPIEARYIKIIFIANNQSAWAGLWEAEFYGHPQTPAGYEDNKIMPLEYDLEQNYPNPFNPSTKIKVQLPKSTRMRLVVYNILGEIIKEIANGEYQSGSTEFDFDATGLASGVYVYRIETPDFVDAKKMVLLR